MRVGVIKHISPKKGFGFIACEGLREDVFFHFTVWQGTAFRADQLRVGDEVEFDLDELNRILGEELKAEKVIPSRRPLSKKIEDHSDPHLLPKHHPRARRRMATWRGDKKDKSPAADETLGSSQQELDGGESATQSID
jgi:cold shock CspA family protein